MAFVWAGVTALGACGGALQQPPPCSKLDVAACAARKDCAVGSCGSGCAGGSSYATCYDPKTSGLACPAIACIAPCASMPSLDACNARPDCHPVFTDTPDACDCADPGCCMQFSACANGANATCFGTVTCHQTQPVCGSGYTVGYANGCFEGCVQWTRCPSVPD